MKLTTLAAAIVIIMVFMVAAIITSFSVVTFNSLDKAVKSSLSSEIDYVRGSVNGIIDRALHPARAMRETLLNNNWTYQKLPLRPAGTTEVGMVATELTSFEGAFEVLATTAKANVDLFSYVYISGVSPYSGVWADLAAAYDEKTLALFLWVPTMQNNISFINAAKYPPWDLTITRNRKYQSYGTEWQQNVEFMTRSHIDNGRWSSSVVYYDSVQLRTVVLITFGMPLEFNSTGSAVSAISIDVSANLLSSLVKNLANKDNKMLIIDARDTGFYNGAIVASSLSETELPLYDTTLQKVYYPTATPNAEVNALMARVFEEFSGGFAGLKTSNKDVIIDNYDGSIVIVAHVYHPESNFHWVVVSAVPRSYYYGSTLSTIGGTIGGGIGFLIICCLLIVYIMLEQQKLVDGNRQTAEISQNVAKNLVLYNTEAAAVVIKKALQEKIMCVSATSVNEKGEEIAEYREEQNYSSKELVLALKQINENLTAYKPHLPEYILPSNIMKNQKQDEWIWHGNNSLINNNHDTIGNSIDSANNTIDASNTNTTSSNVNENSINNNNNMNQTRNMHSTTDSDSVRNNNSTGKDDVDNAKVASNEMVEVNDSEKKKKKNAKISDRKNNDNDNTYFVEVGDTNNNDNKKKNRRRNDGDDDQGSNNNNRYRVVSDARSGTQLTASNSETTTTTGDANNVPIARLALIRHCGEKFDRVIIANLSLKNIHAVLFPAIIEEAQNNHHHANNIYDSPRLERDTFANNNNVNILGTQTSGAVSCITQSFTIKNVNRIIEHILETAHRFDGTIHAIVGDVVTVTFNATSRISQPELKAMNYVTKVDSLIKKELNELYLRNNGTESAATKIRFSPYVDPFFFVLTGAVVAGSAWCQLGGGSKRAAFALLNFSEAAFMSSATELGNRLKLVTVCGSIMMNCKNNFVFRACGIHCLPGAERILFPGNPACASENSASSSRRSSFSAAANSCGNSQSTLMMGDGTQDDTQQQQQQQHRQVVKRNMNTSDQVFLPHQSTNNNNNDNDDSNISQSPMLNESLKSSSEKFGEGNNMNYATNHHHADNFSGGAVASSTMTRKQLYQQRQRQINFINKAVLALPIYELCYSTSLLQEEDDEEWMYLMSSTSARPSDGDGRALLDAEENGASPHKYNYDRRRKIYGNSNAATSSSKHKKNKRKDSNNNTARPDEFASSLEHRKKAEHEHQVKLSAMFDELATEIARAYVQKAKTVFEKINDFDNQAHLLPAFCNLKQAFKKMM